MYIVGIVGSNNPNSITKKIVEQVFRDLEKNNNTEIIWLKENPLEYCLGCNRCFYIHECILDKEDTLGIVKRKLQQADCIVFASPVYMNGCSGVMKSFIDRISYQTHFMWYAGKLSFSIITTAQSGGQIVGDYFNEIQSHLGMKTLGMYVYEAAHTEYEAFILNTAERIQKNIELNFGWSTMKLEKIYRSYYNLYNNTSYGSQIEKDYWAQLVKKNCKSFQEYAILKRQDMNGVNNYAEV